eukprot:7432185-Lingulodinium_polyedra.AAC.1
MSRAARASATRWPAGGRSPWSFGVSAARPAGLETALCPVAFVPSRSRVIPPVAFAPPAFGL